MSVFFVGYFGDLYLTDVVSSFPAVVNYQAIALV